MKIEVVYGYTDRQALLSFEADENITIEEAIKQSGVLQQFDDIDLAVNKVGIFGKLAKLDAKLKDGDRIEIYRPLIADPKEVRRKRAAEGKQTKKGGGTIESSDKKPEAKDSEKPKA